MLFNAEFVSVQRAPTRAGGTPDFPLMFKSQHAGTKADTAVVTPEATALSVREMALQIRQKRPIPHCERRPNVRHWKRSQAIGR
jgi:hypothetical protein